MVFAWDQGVELDTWFGNTFVALISASVASTSETPGHTQVFCHPAIRVSQSSHSPALPEPSEYTRTSSPARPRSLLPFVYVDD
jgi:hypothetical protein